MGLREFDHVAVGAIEEVGRDYHGHDCNFIPESSKNHCGIVGVQIQLPIWNNSLPEIDIVNDDDDVLDMPDYMCNGSAQKRHEREACSQLRKEASSDKRCSMKADDRIGKR